VAIQPLFLDLGTGPLARRFALLHPPHGTPRGLVVYAHPFAEEMNKSRRMAAWQARVLAESGHAVLQVDLLGCGDSAGDLADASWAGWVDDLAQACRWLRRTAMDWHPTPLPLTLWGLRAGALLAAEAAARLGDVPRLLLWQPAPTGKALLQQFLRLHLAGELLDGGPRTGTEALKARLAAGESVEVAGYELPAGVARGLEAARLAPAAGTRILHWLELSTRDGATLSPAAAPALAAWEQAGCSVHAQVVPGPAFWQTTEIEDAPALVAATVAALAEAVPAPQSSTAVP
jgi:uncharacterized protein